MTNRLRYVALISAVLIAACKPETPDLQHARQSASEARAEAAKRSAMVDEARSGAAGDKTALSPEQESLVVARVGESTITLGDVARHIARQPRSTRSRFVSPEQRIALLNNLVEFELLANEAKRLKLDERPAVQLALKAALAQEVISSVGEGELSLADITASEIEAYYQANIASFGKPERRRLSMMVFHTETDAKAVSKELATAVSENPLAAKQVFGDFAQKRSIDAASSVVKGDIGWVDRQGLNSRGQRRLTGVLLDAGFALKTVHTVSSPVELASRQWALVQLTGLEQAETPTLEAVKLQIQDQLLKQRLEARRVAYIEKLRREAKVEVHADALSRIAPPSPAPAVVPPQVPKPTLKLTPSSLRPQVAPAQLNPRAPNPRAPLGQAQQKGGTTSGTDVKPSQETLRSYLKDKQNPAHE